MSGRRESVGRLKARTQSASSAPVQDMVSVAVLPPRLKAGMAPPTGIGGSEAFSWDESINWQHNDKIDANEDVSKNKSRLRRAGITTQRKKLNPDLPPFVLRQVPFETWRNHYAKDKDGNYRGKLAPAEDCLLKPHDVEKWRLGDAVTKADQWTRGREVLPVYAEVRGSPTLPEYECDYDGPPRTGSPGLPPFEDILDPDDDRLISHVERQNSAKSNGLMPPPDRGGSTGSATARQHSYSVSRTDSIAEEPREQGQVIADGKTAKEIIDEAKAKGEQKPTWKQMLSKGVQMASFGS